MANPLLVGCGEKPFPYLGIVWRDIDVYPEFEQFDAISVSYEMGLWWLDVPRKWDYPTRDLTDKEATIALNLWIAMTEKFLEYIKFSQSLKATGERM